MCRFTSRNIRINSYREKKFSANVFNHLMAHTQQAPLSNAQRQSFQLQDTERLRDILSLMLLKRNVHIQNIL
jgi:hypothetical protein